MYINTYKTKYIIKCQKKIIADERQFILNVFENILQEYQLVNIDKTRLY